MQFVAASNGHVSFQIREGMTVMERWHCPNSCCAVGAWMIDPFPEQRDVWDVAANGAESSWTLSAKVPICPLDGQRLQRG